MNAVLLLWWATASGASLESIEQAYQELEYERCVTLSRMNISEGSPRELATRELYAALCAFPLGHESEGLEHFAKAVSLDPTAPLPAMTSPKLRRVHETLAAQALARPLPADAPTRAAVLPSGPAQVVMQPPSRTPHVASVTLGGAAVAAAALGFTFLGLTEQASSAASRAYFESDRLAYEQLAKSRQPIAEVGLALAGAAAVAAVVALLIEVL